MFGQFRAVTLLQGCSNQAKDGDDTRIVDMFPLSMVITMWGPLDS